jgi:hypothetical protein
MKNQSFVLAASAWLLALMPAAGQTTCGCNYVITKDGNYKASQVNVKPGQTICIQAGQYSYLRLNDLVGAPGAPIRVINCGGLVNVLSSSYAPGIQFSNCKYFVLTGSGDATIPYGFRLNNTGTTAGSVLNVTGKSSDFELERAEVSNANFAGIMVKTDPGCDSTVNRGNFTMYNVRIHDCYVHDTGGEGLYIGNSFWNSGVSVTCNGAPKTVYPHEIHGLEVYNNRVERTGCEGIQYGCSPGAKVHHNTVKNTGLSPFASYQNNGIQMGEGSSGDCYNNLVDKAPGGGIIAVGHSGDVKLVNNLLTNVGNIGVFADNRSNSLPNTAFVVLNNTVMAANEGIKLYNENNVITLGNNVVAGMPVAKAIVFAQGATASPFNTVKTTRPDTLGFVNAPDGNYRLRASSPLVNAGADVSAWGVTVDFDDAPRPAGGAFDVGAFEHQPNSPARRSGPATHPAAAPALIGGIPVLWQPDEDAPTALTVTAYPSPCQEYVVLEFSREQRLDQLVVHQPDGRQVIRQNPGRLLKQIRLDTRALRSGTYLYRIQTEQGEAVGRFLKQ